MDFFNIEKIIIYWFYAFINFKIQKIFCNCIGLFICFIKFNLKSLINESA